MKFSGQTSLKGEHVDNLAIGGALNSLSIQNLI